MALVHKVWIAGNRPAYVAIEAKVSPTAASFTPERRHIAFNFRPIIPRAEIDDNRDAAIYRFRRITESQIKALRDEAARLERILQMDIPQ